MFTAAKQVWQFIIVRHTAGCKKKMFQNVEGCGFFILDIIKIYSKEAVSRDPKAFTFDPVNMVFVWRGKG